MGNIDSISSFSSVDSETDLTLASKKMLFSNKIYFDAQLEARFRSLSRQLYYNEDDLTPCFTVNISPHSEIWAWKDDNKK